MRDAREPGEWKGESTMWLKGIVMCVVVLACSAIFGAEEKPRIGVVNPRAAALAYWRSDLHNADLARLVQERDAAKAAGDQDRVKQVETRGKALQAEAHAQVFGAGPYDGLKEHLNPVLPDVAKQANVQVIVLGVLYSDAGAEVVDVTESILKELHASDATRKMIKEMDAKIQRGEYDPAKYPGANEK
jgi:Skp family chaperone for outer membrane proteins